MDGPELTWAERVDCPFSPNKGLKQVNLTEVKLVNKYEKHQTGEDYISKANNSPY